MNENLLTVSQALSSYVQVLSSMASVEFRNLNFFFSTYILLSELHT